MEKLITVDMQDEIVYVSPLRLRVLPALEQLQQLQGVYGVWSSTMPPAMPPMPLAACPLPHSPMEARTGVPWGMEYHDAPSIAPNAEKFDVN